MLQLCRELTDVRKKLPPFATDVVDLNDVDSFNQKGNIGWRYLANQLLGG